MIDTIKQKSQKKNHLMRSSWHLGKTCTIRIPIEIKDRLLDIAKHIDNGGYISLSDHKEISYDVKTTKTILSQHNIDNIITILRHGITSKKQGGVYNSSNANTLKQEVNKVLEILKDVSN
jgi:hypothetical protein